MRISDWSSDVCSSDLPLFPRHGDAVLASDGAIAGGRAGAFRADRVWCNVSAAYQALQPCRGDLRSAFCAAWRVAHRVGSYKKTAAFTCRSAPCARPSELRSGEAKVGLAQPALRSNRLNTSAQSARPGLSTDRHEHPA